MGTDIHAVFQKHVGHDWVDIPCDDWNQGRHYYLFAWLADVRNGFGFAGVKTGEPIKPISKPRGYPEGFERNENDKHPLTDEACCRSYSYGEDDIDVWMGDHSHSWLLGSEILAAPLPRTRKTGVISLEDYKKWDKVSQPEEYSGAIAGRDINVAAKPCLINDHTTHVQVEWCDDGATLQYFVDVIKKLVDQHGTIRMVFGFDS